MKTIARKIRYIVYTHNNILIYNIFPLDISCLFAALIEVFDDIHLLSLLIKKYCVFQEILAEVIKVYIKDNVNTHIQNENYIKIIKVYEKIHHNIYNLQCRKCT